MGSPVTPRAAILHALTSGPGYGLDIMERVAKRSGGAVELHQGTTYPTLRALEADGLAESYESDPLPERGGRPRIYYRLTKAGEAEAERQRAAVAALFAKRRTR